MVLARNRIEQWNHERCNLRNGKAREYKNPGRPNAKSNTNRFDAALVRCIDFEREFSKLTGDQQTILLLAYREHQPHRVIAQIARCSERTISNRIPQALAALAAILDRANLL